MLAVSDTCNHLLPNLYLLSPSPHLSQPECDPTVEPVKVRR